MTNELAVLAGTAATIGFAHTLLGPDHYLPFVAMSKAGRWSGVRTALVTALCGLGHVMSSIVLGFVGVFLGIAVFRLESLESVRGDVAGWFLIAFGFLYLVWGIHRALRRRPHEHTHVHVDGGSHSHRHNHVEGHSHVHARGTSDTLTPWVLFTIFVLGPCEPLIPLIMYPAAKSGVGAIVLVATIFGLTTIATMVGCVMAGHSGLSRISFPYAERYSHALAGLTILLCGGTIKFLGL
jgi:ABC-type nickel/cobalt efflux system permease component RcnA